MNTKTKKLAVLGLLTGASNGIFGAGGGMIAVPLLERAKLEPKKAHATAIAITLPLSICSAVIYGINGKLELVQAMKFVPTGLVGAVCGSALLKKIPNKLLKKVFGVVLIIAGARLMLK